MRIIIDSSSDDGEGEGWMKKLEEARRNRETEGGE